MGRRDDVENSTGSFLPNVFRYPFYGCGSTFREHPPVRIPGENIRNRPTPPVPVGGMKLEKQKVAKYKTLSLYTLRRRKEGCCREGSAPLFEAAWLRPGGSTASRWRNNEKIGGMPPNPSGTTRFPEYIGVRHRRLFQKTGPGGPAPSAQRPPLTPEFERDRKIESKEPVSFGMNPILFHR